MILSKTEKRRDVGGFTQGDPLIGYGDRNYRLNDERKDGYTVKKLIALLVVVVVVSAGIVGCGEPTKATSAPKAPVTPEKGK